MDSPSEPQLTPVPPARRPCFGHSCPTLPTFLWLLPLLLLLTRTALASPGDPDPTFGDGGLVQSGFGGGYDAAHAVAQQVDGKYVVAGGGQNGGWSYGQIFVARYNANGTLDPTFGDDGIAWLFADSETLFVANAVAVQSDGKIVLGGYSDGGSIAYMFVARLDGAGHLDPTFGHDGVAEMNFARGRVQSLMVLADGRIVLAGSSGFPALHLAVGRLLADGTRDGSFGPGGIALAPILDSSIAYAVVLVFGKYLAVGRASQGPPSTTAIALAQFTDTGALDNTFSGDGMATTFVGSQAEGRAVTLQSGVSSPTKIVVSGEANNGFSYSQFVILRYLTDGSLDTTFDSDGYVVPYLGPNDSGARAVRVLNLAGNPSRIIAAGYSQTSFSDWTSEFAVVKVNLAGTLDGTFDGDGIVKTNLGADGATINAMLLGGGITVFGYTGGYYTDSDVALARYSTTTGALDPAFDGDGVRIDDVGSTWSEAEDVALHSDGRIVLAGSVSRAGRFNFAAVRLLPDGTPDGGFGAGGRLEISVGDDDSRGRSVLVQDGDAIVLGGSASPPSLASNGFALARLLADDSADPGFGTNGTIVTTAFEGGSVYDLLEQPDGKLLAAGLFFNSFDVLVGVARYHGNGDIDSTFGASGNGLWSTFAQYFYGEPTGPAAALQPDGRLVLVCEFGGDLEDRRILLVRLTAGGLPDSSFGTGGYVITDLGSGRNSPRGVVVRPDGRIVVAGWTEITGVSRAFVLRYLPNGTIDTSFGDDGLVLIGMFGPFVPGAAMGLRLQPDGRIVVGGSGSPDEHADFAAVRLEPHGVLDTSYGVSGVRLLDFPGSGEDAARAITLDADGNAILAGHSMLNFAAARVLGNVVQTGVPDAETPRPTGVRVSAPRPNPTAHGAALDLQFEAGVRASVHVFDVGGRIVRTLVTDRALAAGRHEISWDGRDDAGRAVPAGVYFVRVATPGGDAVRRVAVVR
jgi:uncharacterized delta-60 repeat protein